MQEIILRQLRLHNGPALLLLTLLAVLATFAPDLRGQDVRQILTSFSEPAPSGSTTDGRLNLFGSPEAPAEEFSEETDEDDPPLLGVASQWACLGARVATTATAAWACPTQRTSSQFATGPPIQ